MTEVRINGRTVPVRALTVGDVCELGPAWTAAADAIARLASAGEEALPALLPEVLQAVAPCLCRMTGLSPGELAACGLAELAALIHAAVEAQRRPFAGNAPSPG